MGRQMRLDQYISTYVELTRKEAKEAIRRGLVCVAGTVVKQANCKIDREEDEHVIGVHDLIVHDYGPGRRFASLHAGLPYNMDMLDAHEIIDTAEKRVKNNLGCDISIHLDPVITDDEQINELRKITNQIISTIDARLSMHDFRVMRGPMMKKLMFDVVVPYDFEISDDVLKKKINSYIKIYDENCYAVINIDRAMVR